MRDPSKKSQISGDTMISNWEPIPLKHKIKLRFEGFGFQLGLRLRVLKRKWERAKTRRFLKRHCGRAKAKQLRKFGRRGKLFRKNFFNSLRRSWKAQIIGYQSSLCNFDDKTFFCTNCLYSGAGSFCYFDEAFKYEEYYKQVEPELYKNMVNGNQFWCWCREPAYPLGSVSYEVIEELNNDEWWETTKTFHFGILLGNDPRPVLEDPPPIAEFFRRAFHEKTVPLDPGF